MKTLKIKNGMLVLSALSLTIFSGCFGKGKAEFEYTGSNDDNVYGPSSSSSDDYSPCSSSSSSSSYTPSSSASSKPAAATSSSNCVRPATLSISQPTKAKVGDTAGKLYSFDVVEPNKTAEMSFRVYNLGGYQATEIAAAKIAEPFRFKGGSFPGDGGDCRATLADQASCTIVLVYNPTLAASHQADLVIKYFDGRYTQNASLRLTALAVAPSNVNAVANVNYRTEPVCTSDEVINADYAIDSGRTYAVLVQSDRARVAQAIQMVGLENRLLSKVTLALKKQYSTDQIQNVVLEVFANAAPDYKPDSWDRVASKKPIASIKVPGTVLTTNYQDIHFAFDGAVNLQAQTTYWIVVRVEGMTGVNSALAVKTDGMNPYRDGDYADSVTSGMDWNLDWGTDVKFKAFACRN